MTDKTEEQIAREKAAVDAMKNAKSNMGTALERIATLESALAGAIAALSWTKKHVGQDSYIYATSPMVRAHDFIDEKIAQARKALG